MIVLIRTLEQRDAIRAHWNISYRHIEIGDMVDLSRGGGPPHYVSVLFMNERPYRQAIERMGIDPLPLP